MFVLHSNGDSLLALPPIEISIKVDARCWKKRKETKGLLAVLKSEEGEREGRGRNEQS